MKKWMLIISIAFFMSLTACDNTDTSDNEDDNKEDTRTITVNFETNGGTSMDPLTIEEGTLLNPPDEPTKQGYAFNGWSTSRYVLDPFDFDLSLDSDMTLFAHWDQAQTSSPPTLTFDSNGGSNVSDMTRDAGDAITEPTTPVRIGYVFEGWYEERAFITPFVFDTMPRTSMTIYAKWRLDQENQTTYTLSFDSNGGSAVDAIIQEGGTSLNAPDAPIRNGYVFIGWYENSQLTTPFTFDTMPSTSKTLYAKWEANQEAPTLYTLSFNSNGGSIHTPLSLEEDTTLPDLPTPFKADHTFSGWFTDVSLTTAFTRSTMPSNNITVYAKWESIPTADDLVVETLELYDFECASGVCTLNIASNVYYQYSAQSKAFSFTSLENTVENGYYRTKNETLIINSHWNVGYTYILEENYGILYSVDFEYSGTVTNNAYSVTSYDSNYMSEDSLVTKAQNRITQLKSIIDSVFDAIDNTEFEGLN